MDKVCLALIHNHDVLRNAYIQVRLVELHDYLSSRFEVTSLEVAYQPAINPHSMPMAFFRHMLYQVLEFSWRRYRLIPALKGRTYTLRSRRGWRRSSAIEMAVTDKHIRAWTLFLESGADFLVCFEDDAVFRNSNGQQLVNLLDKLIQEKSAQAIFVDLAGGCALDVLEIDKLQIRQDSTFRYYCKPVTNTACVYLLSRPLAITFCDILSRNLWLRLIGVDWIMNVLFILMEKAGIKCDCMHADETIFCHGSVTGLYKPWER